MRYLVLMLLTGCLEVSTSGEPTGSPSGIGFQFDCTIAYDCAGERWTDDPVRVCADDADAAGDGLRPLANDTIASCQGDYWFRIRCEPVNGVINPPCIQ